MSDVNISKFRTSVNRPGSAPASPGFAVSEGQNPVEPSGTSQDHLPVTIAPAATGLSITESQVLGGAGTTSQYLRGDGSLDTFPDLTGYVPYTGANQTVNLNTQQLLAGHTTITTNGSTDALTVNHTSGSGKGINVTKGGAGEGLYINKTSGSGNAATIVGTLEATTLVKTGGTSAQFLKADGSVDSTSYGTGTVTSVGLSSATSGVTIGSTPVTTSGTITLAIATASGSQNGLLSSTDWTTFNNKMPAITFSSPLFIASGGDVGIIQASGSSNGFLSSTDWTTFNNKQNALTNPVTGTGTTNYLPKFTGASTIGNSNVINDASGNLGLGVTPSAWASGFRAIQMTSGTSLMSHPSVPITYLSSNYLATDLGPRYIQSDGAARFLVNGWQSQFSWEIAPSGTAGAAISFTQAMTLTSSGNLLVGITTDNGARLQVSGFGTISNGLQISGGPAGYGGAELVLNSASDGLNAIYTNGGGAVGMFFDHRGTSNSGYWVFRNGTGAGSERLRITSSGNVGIGTTSPSRKITVSNPANGDIALFTNTADADLLINLTSGVTLLTPTTSILAFGTSNTERMRISGGNVLIGTTTDSGYKLDVNGTGRFSGNVRIDKSIPLFVLNDTSGSGAQIGSFGGNLNLIDNATGTKGMVMSLSTGAATFSSSVTATSYITSSDARLKNVISKDGDLAIYSRLDSENIHYGYIAQDMEKDYPNQVHTDDKGFLSLNYVEILVKKVNDLEKKIKQLEQ